MQYFGLTSEQVLERKAQYGENLLKHKQENMALKVFIEQFRSPIIYLLLGTAMVTVLFQEWTDAILILAVLVFDVIFGFYQEYTAQKTLKALKQIIDPQTTVIRNGKRQPLSTKELVPGDLVVLGPGDIVPADGTLSDAVNILVREAILTGEKEAVSKEEGAKVFMGTSILSGSGIMEVTAIGQKSEFGKIGLSLMEMEEQDTPLQRSLGRFSNMLTKIVVAIALLIFLIGLLYERSLWDSLSYAIILALAAIPEGLPIIVTVILSLGMRRILKQKGLVKNLLSVETLGSTTVICTDKTGTLTEGNMRVVQSTFANKNEALISMIINNDQRSNMEIAMYDFARQQDMATSSKALELPKTYREPFSSETKYSFTVSEAKAYLSGAPEHIIKMSNLNTAQTKTIENTIDEWASTGLRVVAFAYKDKGDLKEMTGFNFAGLLGIDDPIRPSAKNSLKEAKRAGIKVKIITGDYKKTAAQIAKALELDISPEEIMEGPELEKASAEELRKQIAKIKLFARVSPQHKLKIVEALQANGEVVAMTGDGVNDVLALKKADIGIAMGNASDVAKEAADLVLLKNDFRTIVSTCEEGRLVYMNIKKVIGYILSNSFAEILLILSALLLRLPLPLSVAQILWIHLICDGPPDIALGFDHNKEGLLEEKPRDYRKDPILSSRLQLLIFGVSSTIALLGLIIFSIYSNVDSKLGQTMTFGFFSIISLVYILSYKDLNQPIFKMHKIFENKVLFWSILYGFILTFVAIYVPFLNEALGTIPLTLEHWLVLIGASLFVTLVVELIKAITRSRRNFGEGKRLNYQ